MSIDTRVRCNSLTVRLPDRVKQRLYIAFLTDVPCHYQREVFIIVGRTGSISTHLSSLFELLFPSTREHDTPLTGLGQGDGRGPTDSGRGSCDACDSFLHY
jgi:hypothetical protein